MGKEEELIKAVKAKDIKKVQKLLTSTSVKKRGEDAMWQSVDTGHKICKHLTHINVDAKDTVTGGTPLLLAVLGGLRDVAETLIFCSANVLAQDFRGNTALHLAVFGGRADLVSLLLANGADVNSVNDDQNTALHIACQHSVKTPLVLSLIQAGANMWLQNKEQHSALDTAAMYNKKEVVSVMMELCPTLSSNQCAIVEGAMRDNVEVVELLLDYGVDPNKLDPLRGSTALHEAVRFSRTRSCELLLAFGADAEKENMKKETPRSLCKDLPTAVRHKLETLFTEYSGHQSRIPKHVTQRESVLTDSFRMKCLKNYPVLPSQQRWTQNSHQYCSSCTEANSNLHVVDDNMQTFWVIPVLHDAWTSLDLGSPHIITGITIIGWDSPQMVHMFELQAAESIQGPWTTFTVHTCKRVGSSDPKEPGVMQTFKGFTVKVRYLRLYIVDNHGGNSICFQGMQLHGADCRVLDVLHSCQKQHLADAFFENGINTYKRLIDTPESVLAALIDDPVEMSELHQVIQAERRTVYTMRTLEWLVSPPPFVYSDEEMASFSVQSDPGVSEEVEVKVEGAEVQGTTRVRLSPIEEGKASTAVFDGLVIKTVGHFTISVQGVTTPISINTSEQIEIRPPKKRSTDISSAFDEIQRMLSTMQETL